MGGVMTFVEIEWLGKTVRIPAQKINGQTWYHIDGQTYCYEPLGQRRKQGSSEENASPGVCLAPMPGKIIKLAAKKNQQVKKGDLLVAMEAMKMEYSLESDIDGVVTEVNCSEGDQVQLQQTLIIVKAEE